MKIAAVIDLMRVRQWYKNLVVFLALFFSGNLFDWQLFLLVLLGFVIVCLTSSAGYVINDIIDLERDRAHPEKRNRPLASGKISNGGALILTFILLIGAAFMMRILPVLFLPVVPLFFIYTVVVLFLLTLFYSSILKNIIFADVLTISTLFVLRAIAGAVMIDVVISPWLILGPFFLSLFLSIGKRHADLLLLKEKSFVTREVLKEYNVELTNSLMIISTTLLIISYALYSFLSDYNYLIYTIPFALFVIFRFYYLIQQGSVIARHPERIIRDRQIIGGILLWLLVTGFVIYG